MRRLYPSLSDLPDPPDGKSGWPWTKQSAPLPGTQPDGTPWPKISVVTPSYNQGQFIEETIRSVLLQRYPKLEYIVMDGGSDDETVEIIEKYNPWIDNWVSEPDEGQADAVNKGFNRASGEIYAWLNSDDYYASEALSLMAEKFGEYSNAVGAVVGIGHKVNESGEIVSTPGNSDLTREDFFNWLSGGSFMQPACFFRRTAWEDCGPLRADLRYAMDVDFFLRMSRQYRFEGIEETISYAHKHPDAKTTGERSHWRAEVIFQLYEHGGKEAAIREVQELGERLRETRNQIHAMNTHPLFKWAMRVWRYVLS